MTDTVKASLVFRVHQIPREFLPAKVVFTIGAVRPYCSSVIAQLEGPDLGNVDPLSLQAPMLACDFKNLQKPMNSEPEKLQRFFTCLEQAKTKLLVLDVASSEDRRCIMTLGAHFAT